MLISIIVFIWLVAVVIELYYWLMVVWPLEAHRGKRTESKAPVSVIVCAHRGNVQLEQLLGSVLHQDYPDFEVVLVNDGPDADVARIAGTYDGDERLRVLDFKREEDTPAGKKAPLAFGLEHARNEWILLTDSDCSVRDGWISSMMSRASAKVKLVLGYSPMMRRTAFASRMSAFDTLMIAGQYLGWAIRDRVYMGVGRNILYYKSLFEEVGGFERHADLASGDDDLLVQEMALLTKTEICLDTEGIVYSEPKRTMPELIGQKLRHISTAGRYDARSSRLVWIMGASFTAFWSMLPLIFVFTPGIPMLIAAVSLLTQWWVFFRVSKVLEARRFVAGFPLWCLLYTGFLFYLGAMKALGRTPRSWS